MTETRTYSNELTSVCMKETMLQVYWEEKESYNDSGDRDIIALITKESIFQLLANLRERDWALNAVPSNDDFEPCWLLSRMDYHLNGKAMILATDVAGVFREKIDSIRRIMDALKTIKESSVAEDTKLYDDAKKHYNEAFRIVDELESICLMFNVLKNKKEKLVIKEAVRKSVYETLVAEKEAVENGKYSELDVLEISEEYERKQVEHWDNSERYRQAGGYGSFEQSLEYELATVYNAIYNDTLFVLNRGEPIEFDLVETINRYAENYITTGRF